MRFLLFSVILQISSGILFRTGSVSEFSEQQRDAPQSGQTDQCIDDSAKYCTLSTKEPCNQIKLKNAY